MPQQMSFEEVVSDLMARNPHMSHGDALTWMSQQREAGNQDVARIPDIDGKIANAHMIAMANQFTSGVTSTLGAPFGKLSGMLAAATQPGTALHRGFETAATALSPEQAERVTSQVGPSPGAKFLGEGAGLTALAEGTGLGPATRAYLPGTGTFSKAVKGGLEMLGLEKMGALGKMSPGEAIFWGAAPPVGLAMGGVAGRALGVLGPKVEEDAAGASVGPPAPGKGLRHWWETGYWDTKAPPEVEAPSEAPSAEPSAKYEDVGPRGMRAGQPFEAKFMSRTPSNISGADIYHGQNHPVHGSGPPYPGEWKKPFVIDVPNAGPEGWVHAATSVFAKNPRIVERLQDAQDPVGLAQTLLANEAKARGYDAVNLAPPDDPANGVILDLRKYVKSKHPEATADLYRFGPRGEQAKPASKAADAGEAVFGKSKKPSEARPFEQARVEAGQNANPIATLIDGSKVELNRLSPGGPGYGDGSYLGADGNLIDKSAVKSVSYPKGTLRGGHAQGDPTLAARESIVERARSHEAGDLNAQDVAKAQHRLTGSLASMDPETRQAVQKYLTGFTRNPLVRYLPPGYMSDHPVFQGMYQDTMTQVAASNKEAAALEKIYQGLRRQHGTFGAKEKFDELARAVDGLGYEPENGWRDYVQSAVNVSKETNDAARAFATMRDRGYTFLTNNDPRVPYILERYGLAHNRWQLTRLRDFQDPLKLATYVGKAAPKGEELLAARDMKGMLHFNETHDLDFAPLTGWMKFHPHANEKALLQDEIRHLQENKRLRGDYQFGFADEVQLEQALKRNQELEDRAFKQQMSRAPNRDFVPKRKWMSILHGEGHPYFYSTDPNEVMSQWVTGITQKRVADVALARIKGLLADETVDGATKDYAVEFGNAVRGSTGYAADVKAAQTINSWFHGMGFKGVDIQPHEVHKWAGTIQQLNFLTKLGLSPLRFPVINLTHLLPTAGAVAPTGAFVRGILKTIGDMSGSYARAVDAGVISRELEMFKEIGARESSLGRIGKPLQALTWLTENFRKTAAYNIGLESARDGVYSKVVRGFVNDPAKYANETERQLAYARAFTFTTQFEFGKTGKAVAFQGGPMRRTITQFRSWESNMIGLYKEMLHQGDYKAFAKGMIALGFLGGGSVAAPLGTWDLIRNGLLKYGYNLPNQPGYHYAAKLAGLPTEFIDSISLRSLSDPFGFNPGGLSTFLGPTLGSMLDLGKNISYDLDRGKYKKIPRELITAFAPQAQDIIEAVQEYVTGGVASPGGMVDQNRSGLSIFMRGVDLQPSVRTQRAQYEADIERALVAAQSPSPATAARGQKLVQELMDEMKSKNLIMSPDMQRRMRAFVRGYKRSEAQPWEF